jgi:2-iminobutanoate/2-iminopropanoate deaminase
MIKLKILFGFALLIFANAGCKNNNDSIKQVNQTGHKNKAAIKEKWHWGNAQKQNESAGYAQVVKVGNTLYISGIPTADLSLKGVAEVYKALDKCLHVYGATSKDVIKETLYTTDIETMKKCNGARKEFYKGDFPAATWVQVSRLYEPDAELEVELIAQLKGSGD